MITTLTPFAPGMSKDIESSATLCSYSIPWGEESILKFLKRAKEEPRFYWENDQETVAFSGFGIAACLSADGPHRFEQLEVMTKNLFSKMVFFGDGNPENIYPRLFGGFSFGHGQSEDALWDKFGEGKFILPKYLLTRCDRGLWLTVSRMIDHSGPQTDIRHALLDQVWNLPVPEDIQSERSFGCDNDNFIETSSYDHWELIVDAAVAAIHRGDFNKVVLAHARELHLSVPDFLDLIMDRLKVSYPDCYRFVFEPEKGQAFFGATPELLVKTNGNKLSTMALAGSLKRGRTYAEDNELANQLAESEKDLAEHELVIEDILHRLSIFVENISISERPQVMSLKNVQHLYTPIQANLLDQFGVLRVLGSLHPTPAVGGTPLQSALDFIIQQEGLNRGWYAGPIGWIGPNGDGIFAVALRSAVTNREKTRLFAGAGIVADSVPEKEWRETGWKFQAIQDAICGYRGSQV